MPTSAKPGASRFVANPYFPEELKRSTMLIDDMAEKANTMMDEIVAGAPADSGEFAASFSVESGIEDGEATARIITDDRKAYFIEYGTEEHEFNAPIRKGIERAGFTLEGSGA